MTVVVMAVVTARNISEQSQYEHLSQVNQIAARRPSESSLTSEGQAAAVADAAAAADAQSYVPFSIAAGADGGGDFGVAD